MILYLDSSAIVKKYVEEPGSVLIREAVEQAEVVGTTVISRTEVIAAFRKAVRTDVIGESEGQAAVRSFNKSWRDLVRTRVTERLVQHASELAWVHGLRGYDSLQLASAAAWQQAIGLPVTLATFNVKLWNAGRAIGLRSFPNNLPDGR